MEALIRKTKNIREAGHQKINSGTLTLKEVAEQEIRFNIPIYQRLYVWKRDQVRTLLEDMQKAFLNNAEDYFFLGGIMITKNPSGKIDLVDGQQRFTTLWLLCDLLSEKNEQLKDYTYFNDEPRIFFSIRDQAQAYLKDENSFKKFIGENGKILPGAAAEITEIVPLVQGREIINSLIGELTLDKNFDLGKFSEYIFTKVTFTFTMLPETSDMNRIFEAVNNRGKQLEHHQLLKSKLLKPLDEDDKLIYGQLWDACSDMNAYFEKSIKDVSGLTWKALFDNKDIETEYDEESDTNKNRYNLINIDLPQILKRHHHSDEIEKSLFDILKSGSETDSKDRKTTSVTEPDFGSGPVRSIISFPMFLLHVLRIYQALKPESKEELSSVEVNDKKLIELFMKEGFQEKEKAKKYLDLLWKIRVLFDDYVIKWVYDGELSEEHHNIKYVVVSKSNNKDQKEKDNETISVQRAEQTDPDIRNLVMLQGMLYHSQEMTTQYWLTPFLYYVFKETYTNRDLVERLEILENHLFYNKYPGKKLKDRTFDSIFKNKESLFEDLKDSRDYLAEFRGTDYPNYIFYKVEYVLWKNRAFLCGKYGLDIQKWDLYRLTAKNSVEHIFPQNSKQENAHIEFISELEKERLQGKNALDDFGNLVLLSPGMNSEYSNKSYLEKQGQFISKIYVDSLKSDLIFRKNEYWNWEKAKQHREEISDLLEEYITKLK